MGWDAVMFGSLRVPEANLEEWLSSPLLLDEQPWLEELAGDDVRAGTPEALLGCLAETQVEPHELFEVQREGAALEVGCFVGEDVYRATCQPLAVLFASAGEFGGAGELTFLGYRTIQFGERLTLSKGQAVFRRLSRVEQEAAERGRTFKVLDGRIHSRFDALVGRTPPPGAKLQWAVNPFTGRRVRVAL